MRHAMNGFTYQHRVVYSECTVGNHVYHSRYLDILEATRGAFFRSLDLTFQQLQEQGCILPVTECHLQYHGAARYDDVLQVRLCISEIRRVRLRFHYDVTGHDDQPILQAWTRHGATDLQNKIIRLPAELVERLEAYRCPESGARSPGDDAPVDSSS